MGEETKAVRSKLPQPKLSISKFILLLLAILLSVSILLQKFAPGVQPAVTGRKTRATVEKTSQNFAAEANDYLTARQIQPGLTLILQKDERWFDANYGGTGAADTIAQNGCALTVLAMVDSYWQGKLVSPRDILNWSGEKYYAGEAGTSWNIFPAFAEEHGYQLHNPGNIAEALADVRQGWPVIVSVGPGTFTEVGHFIVLAQNPQGEIIVFDPNDDKTKEHYQQTFGQEVLTSEALNYWTLRL